MRTSGKIIIAILSLVIAICILLMARILFREHREKRVFESLTEDFVQNTRPKEVLLKEVVVTDEAGNQKTEVVEVTDIAGNENTEEKPDASSNQTTALVPFDNICVDYRGLYEKNNDYAGWIHMDNGVNYPIVQGETTDEYLHLDFHRKESSSGSIILSSKNNRDFSDRVNVLYGHNMRNKTMFGNNQNYLSEDYARQHPYVFLHLEGRYLVYRVCALLQTTENSDVYSFDFGNEKEFLDYIGYLTSESLYVHDSIGTSDRLLLLSTCTGSAGGEKRLVVVTRYIGFVNY